MRFEIRAGGAFLILLALGVLSAAVFALGLIAGYEMAGQDQSNRPIVSVYPLPKLPASQAGAMAQAEATPAGAGAPVAAAASSPAPGSLAAASAPPKLAGPPPKVAPVRAAVASAPPPAKTAPPEPSRAAAEEAAKTADAGRKPAPARVPVARSKPYNIQIGAVMDKRSAEDMVGRLRRLGYLPYIVETDIEGQAWYRVRVGPYESEAEARAAEVELRQRYNGAPTAR